MNNARDFRYFALIGLGANMKNEEKTFRMLVKKLLQDNRFTVHKSSPLLINKAFGYEEQKDFTNAVLALSTSLSPFSLLKALLHYEKIFGRKRSFKNAPRVLDLDILYMWQKNKSLKIRHKNLSLPHPGALNRVSVFLPLGLLGERFGS